MKALREKIEQEIRQHGPIPFSRYMEMCLYDEDLGYYASHANQFGKAGDFYTSSDVHAVFGRLMARQFEEMWHILGRPSPFVLLELGPGRGLFARDVLDWSARKFPDFFGALHYRLSEGSAALRKRLEQNLQHHFESGRVSFLSQDDAFTSHHAVFANEFFDALPVDVLSAQGSLRIDTRDGRFVETWAPCSSVELEFLDRYSIHPEPGERVEIAPRSQQHMSKAASLEHGFIIAIDYGYTRDELLAGRHRGTLKAIRQHSVSANPYEAPGEQDITADVNFTALAATAQERGLHAHKLVTQSQFLMGIGEANQFGDAFEDCRLPQERAKVALQLKHLVTPTGMGESFHVLVASNGVDPYEANRLAGLSFGVARR